MSEETRGLSATEVRAWRGLLAMWHFGFPEIERALKPWGLLHVEYGMLAVLSMQPDHALRLGHLANLAGMSPSRLTARLRPLVERGLVERTVAADDGRSVVAQLTPAGLELLDRVAPTHIAQVKAMIFDRLNDQQVQALADAMSIIAAGLSDDVWWTATEDQ